MQLSSNHPSQLSFLILLISLRILVPHLNPLRKIFICLNLLSFKCLLCETCLNLKLSLTIHITWLRSTVIDKELHLIDNDCFSLVDQPNEPTFEIDIQVVLSKILLILVKIFLNFSTCDFILPNGSNSNEIQGFGVLKNINFSFSW